jgi:ribosomal protein S18 acetylase RimI-like enzyme
MLMLVLSLTGSMNEVTIRPAAQSDFDFLFHLVCITMKDYVAATTGWDEVKEKEIFTRYFDFSAYQISVIVLDGNDIGYLKIDRTDAAIFLANVHVHPDHQNQGIGSKIIKSLLVEAEQQGVPVSLKVLKVNQAARRLYERFGFSIEEEAEDYYLMRALHSDALNPTLRLDSSR